MNLKTQIIIDKVVGSSLMLFINLLSILKGSKTINFEKIDYIVIAKFKGLGSIIQATPLIQTLKKEYPNAKIIFFTQQNNNTLISILKPIINQTILIDDSSIFKLLKTFIQAILKLRKLNNSIFIDLEVYSNLGKITTFLSSSNTKLGFSEQQKNVYTKSIPFNSEIQIRDLYLEFGSILKCKESVKKLFYPVVKRDKYEFLKTANYIVVNPNASDLRIERRWTTSNFSTLINKILEQKELKIVLIGSKSETNYVEEITSNINPKFESNIIDLTGKTTLEELFFVIDHSLLMISTDSGPMNFSLALGKKTIALFGPVNPIQYGSFEHCIPIYNRVECSPCVHQYINPPCNGNNICMQNITVEKVLEKTFQTLE